LGLLAGTFGAGILANVIGRVGIAVAMIYYINAQMSFFGIDIFSATTGLTGTGIGDILNFAVFGLVNLVMAIGSVFMIWESMGGGKES